MWNAIRLVSIRHAILVAALIAAPLVGCQNLNGEPRDDPRVAYPDGYRDWTHVKSMAILPGHRYFEMFGGLHHVYANDEALAALKGGGPFADGAVLVFDLREAIVDGNAVTEGRRPVIGVMERDAVRFAATEGWGFEDFRFVGDTVERSVTDARTQCLSCHDEQQDSGYVYSKYRE